MKRKIISIFLAILTVFCLAFGSACDDSYIFSDTGASSGSSSGSSAGSSTDSSTDSSSGGSTTDEGSGGSGGTSGGTSSLNNESRALTMAIGRVEGNFNPFFSTDDNDGEVISLTQASMLTTDSNGNISCGEDEPSVVKDYIVTSYSDNEEVVPQASANADNTAYTTYSFLIKNGMKFSDGEDLTIMDVLFSLYTNLDLAYTGDSILYSNDIQGLNAYREQDATLTDDSSVSSSASFNAFAMQRITDIVNYCNDNAVATNRILADIETVKDLFYEEVASDWDDAEETFNSLAKDALEYNFTEVWQYFYLMEGIIEIQTTMVQNASGNWVTAQEKNSDDTYKTTLDVSTVYADEIAEVKADEAAIKVYTDKGYDYDAAVEYVVRDFCIDVVWETLTGGYGSENTFKAGIAQIVQYWATADTAMTYFANEERTAYFTQLKENNGGTLAVETISGVTTERVTSFNGVALDGTYDVLNITINDVDPTAIWNFAFTVAPLHYYSGTWGGTNYVQEAMDDYEAYCAAWDSGDTSYILTKFGVECGNSDFFSDVIGDETKSMLPVGAGPYAASSSAGCATSAATAESFYSDNHIYYVRNDYFYTMGSELSNARIKYVTCVEMYNTSMLTYVMEEMVDYAIISATTNYQNQLSVCSDYLSSVSYYTNGYGYVGINPKYIPDETVRQVLMMTMNNNSIVRNYYGESEADVIYRPMSKVSWAYPDGASAYYTYTTDTATIRNLMESAGYWLNSNGIYTNGEYTCNITFTIINDNGDYPVYDMFCETEKLLEQCGFDITVNIDPTAASKLSTGNLEVWAAEWTSGVDPDMYEMFHMDSTASMVKNWNYAEILANPTDSNWSYEYDIIFELSDAIDKARQTNNQDTRAAYYSTALDYVMDLAVQMPTYQRKDIEVYNKNVIKASSLNQNPSCYSSLMARIWEVEYV